MEYNKENVLAKLVEVMNDYNNKFSKADKADEKVAYAIAESVVHSLINDFETEFE